MAFPPWPKGNEKALAAYAIADTAGIVRLPVRRDDLLAQGRRQELLEAIYNSLLNYDIRYAREIFDPTLEQQRIREPQVILRGSGDATCLDLALLLAGLCLGNELLPLVLVLDGHALVAISLVRDRRDAGLPGRLDEDQDGAWAAEGLLTDAPTLRRLIARGDYLLVECTGFAQGELISPDLPEGKGRTAGRLLFPRALEAGAEQLGPAGRAFLFAIDVAFLQDVRRIPPYPAASVLPSVPLQAPALRSGFVPRPAVIDQIRLRLFAGGALRIVALHGIAGSGKSVMAAAIAADPQVLARFRDGVLWTSTGLSPDVTSILAGWIQALGAVELQFTSPDAARRQLQSMLAARAILIVIDDVWEPAHAAALLAGGPRCGVLITTREASVARACEIPAEDILELPAMTTAEARMLVAGGEGRTLPQALFNIVDDVAESVGRLPLALHLAAAQAADDVPWDEIRDDLRQEMARLEALDLPGAADLADLQLAKQQSLIASLALSLRRLPPDRLAQFTWLGVTAYDAVITSAAAATLWATAERTARDGLRYLQARALLERSDGAGFTLHPAARAAARRLLVAPLQPPPADPLALPGLGFTLASAHAELLRRYSPDSAWHTVPDDGYIHAHLAWHFERAGRPDLLHALLARSTPTGANAWFDVRDRMHHPEGFIADVRRAWELAPLSLHVRYALLLASLQSLATNAPPELVGQLVRAGVWSIPYAAAYAANIAQPTIRALAFARLAERAEAAARRELFAQAAAAAQEITEEDPISALAPVLAAHGFLSEALALARRLGNQSKATTLAAIAGALPASERSAIVAEALDAAIDSGPLFRSEAVASLAPYLDEPSCRRLLADCEKIPAEKLREAAVSALLPRLAALGFQPEALRRAQSLHSPLERASCLADLSAASSEPARTHLLRQLLALLPKIDQDQWAEELVGEVPDLEPTARSFLRFSLTMHSHLAEILQSLPADLPAGIRKKLLLFIDRRTDPIEAARALAAIASGLPETEIADRRQRTVQRIRTDLPRRGIALATLITTFPPDQRSVIAREALESLPEELSREDMLRDIAPYLDEAGQARVFEILATAIRTEDRPALFSILGPFLPPPDLSRALSLCRRIEDDDALLLAAAALAPGLDSIGLAAILEFAPQVSNEYVRARALAAVLPLLPVELIPNARTIIDGITGQALSEVALPALAKRLTGEERDLTLEKAIVTAASLDDPFGLVMAFEAFVGQLSTTRIPDAVERLDQALLQHPEYPETRVSLLVAAAGATAGDLREAFLQRALEIAADLRTSREPAGPLLNLAYAAASEHRLQIEDLAAGLTNPFDRASVYAALATNLEDPDEAHNLALRAITLIVDFVESDALGVNQQAEIIGGRAVPYLHPRTYSDTLGMIAGFEDKAFSSQALVGMAPRLHPSLVSRALDLAAALPEANRSAPLLALSGRIPMPERLTILGNALDAAFEQSTELYDDDTLSPVALRLAELQPADIEPHYRRAITRLAGLPRPAALAKLQALAPLLLHVNGPEGAQSCLQALNDVHRWWP